MKVKGKCKMFRSLTQKIIYIYINDIDEGLTNRIIKFVDDKNLFGVVTNGDDVEKMKVDFCNLCDSSREWLMLFNVDKCTVKALGVSNENV